jgi:hypothetical protein
MNGQAPIVPEMTWGLVVGVESYPRELNLNLNGPFRDACRFAHWLIGCGVPASHIIVLASPLETNNDLCKDLQDKEVACEIGDGVTPRSGYSRA